MGSKPQGHRRLASSAPSLLTLLPHCTFSGPFPTPYVLQSENCQSLILQSGRLAKEAVEVLWGWEGRGWKRIESGFLMQWFLPLGWQSHPSNKIPPNSHLWKQHIAPFPMAVNEAYAPHPRRHSPPHAPAASHLGCRHFILSQRWVSEDGCQSRCPGGKARQQQE